MNTQRTHLRITHRFLRLGIALLIIALACPGSIALADPIEGGTGPGGVGRTDGSGTLRLWLQADKGVTSSGGNVTSWADQSGNGLAAIQATASQQPTLQTNQINGFPVIRFDGGDYLNLGQPASLDFTPGTDSFTIISVVNVATDDMGTTISRGRSATRQYQQYISGNRSCLIVGGGGATGTQTATGSPTILTGLVGTGGCYLYLNSANDGSGSIGSTVAPDTDVLIGARRHNDNTDIGFPLTGDIAEVIVYSGDLVLAERIMVENYLSAKYDIDIPANGPIGGNDHYAGDTSSNGDYDLDVAGVGIDSDTSGTSVHREAHSAGLILEFTDLLGIPDRYILAGHKVANNDNTNADVTGLLGANGQRWTRVWYLDCTDCPSENVTFDRGEGGMDAGSPFGGPTTNYVLLYSSGSAFSWVIIRNGASSVTTDQVAFNGYTVMDGYYTLGTRDEASSPTAITLPSLNAHPRVGVYAIVLLLALAVGNVVWIWRAQRRRRTWL